MDKYTATEQAFKHGYEKGYEAGYADCLADRNWIPVSERMPERGQEVIVASYRTIKPVVFTTNFWSKEYDNWVGITHWMPLPEPPKEG